jgi:uncharacterized protein YidB (DUF937 family)
MGLFDGLLKKVGGVAGAAELASKYPAIKDALIEVVKAKGPSGLQDLVGKIQGAGMGDIVSSWISTGGNLPANASQIAQALGPDVIEKIAAKVGLPAEKVSAGLAVVLPMVIDKLSPQGKLPEKGGLDQAMSLLKNIKF